MVHALVTETEITRLRALLVDEKAKGGTLLQVNRELRTALDEMQKELRLLRGHIKQLRGGWRRGHLLAEGQGTLFGAPTAADASVVVAPEHVDEAPDGETPFDRIKKRHKPKHPSGRRGRSTRRCSRASA